MFWVPNYRGGIALIEVKNLTKRYGGYTAVSDLSFTIDNGRIYGFLGPNGAGKSTTMNIMTGCLAATEGSVSIDGLDIFEDAAKAKRRIGYLPELPPLYPDMTPREYLRFVAQAKGLDKKQTAEQIARAEEVTQIEDVENRLIRNLSKGYRQRVGIAQALLGDPEVIILDEPTVGLDPKQITEIRDLIRKLGEKHTVILSSHILSEVRAVCDHIMIISKGKLVASDTPEKLEQLFAGKAALELTVKATREQVSAALRGVSGITKLEVADAGNGISTASIEYEDVGADEIAEAVFFAFCAVHKPVLRMESVRASLEDVFLELTRDGGDTAVSTAKADEKEGGAAQ